MNLLKSLTLALEQERNKKLPEFFKQFLHNILSAEDVNVRCIYEASRALGYSSAEFKDLGFLDSVTDDLMGNDELLEIK